MLQDVDGGHLKVISGKIQMIVAFRVAIHCHYLKLIVPATWIHIPSYQELNISMQPQHRAADIQTSILLIVVLLDVVQFSFLVDVVAHYSLIMYSKTSEL
jgi:hypothetical protein